MENEKKETPQDRWKRKNNYITKGFRMYKSLSDEYKEACEKVGVGQSEQITKMMREFIDSQKGGG